MELSLSVGVEQQLRVSPSLIALNQILALTSQELQDEIRRELESNPALEMDERKLCSTCGGAYKGEVCRRCLAEGLTGYSNGSGQTDYYGDEWVDYSARNSGEEFDPLMLVAAEMPLSERILADLTAVLASEDMQIAEFLTGSLDERGYLTTDVPQIAQAFNTDEERVARILQQFQQIAPSGVGARNPQECLLLQYRQIKEEGITAPLVEEILTNYFAELGERKYGYIAKQLGVSPDEVKQAREFIKHNLNPFPAEGQTGEVNGSRYANGTQTVVPDVIISYDEGEFKIEVIESKRFFLRISPLYRQLFQDTGTTYGESDQEHIRRYVNRAKLFLSNIEQRRQTILKITEAIVRQQEDFLREGVREMQPLTRANLATYIGVHESTVSRATAGKYVMLPNRRVIPFADFFQKNLSIKDIIKEIIEKADTESRLTDQEVVRILEEQYQVSIARRTVAKYRNQLKILPSTIR
jgi:RNA polymerase sigma-54 factor